jgi:hypothetical protein
MEWTVWFFAARLPHDQWKRHSHDSLNYEQAISSISKTQLFALTILSFGNSSIRFIRSASPSSFPSRWMSLSSLLEKRMTTELPSQSCAGLVSKLQRRTKDPLMNWKKAVQPSASNSMASNLQILSHQCVLQRICNLQILSHKCILQTTQFI